MQPAPSDAPASATEVEKFEDRVLRPKETEQLTGLSDMQLWRMEQAGSFPKRFKLNPAGGPRGAAGHSNVEVRCWLAGRRASRNAAA